MAIPKKPLLPRARTITDEPTRLAVDQLERYVAGPGGLSSQTTTLDGGKVGIATNIFTTLPLVGGGSLTSDLTLAVNTFGTAASGVVPASGGGTTNFLRADVSWAHPMVIGSPVDSGTAGSVLFIGAGPVLAQDNANLFYDATNKRLGIGTNNPGGGYGIAPDLTMHLYRPAAHNLVLIESQGVSCDCGIAMYTRINGYDTAIFTDESDAQKLKFALGGYSTGGASPGDLSSHSGRQSATAMYIAQNGDVAIGSAVYWTSSSKVLTITQSAADPADGTGCITLKNTLSSSLSQITWRDHTSAFKCANGFSNSSGHFYWYTGTGVPIEINLNNGGTQHLFASDGGFQLAASTSAVSSANTGRRRYTTTGQKFQVSMNGGAYVDEVSASAAGTSNTTAKFTAANQIANGWALDDGTTWGVSGKFTIAEATGATTISGATTINNALTVAVDSGRVIINHPTSTTYATFDFARASARRLGMGLNANSDDFHIYRATGTAGSETETEVLAIANSTGVVTIDAGLSMSSQKITSLANGTASSDAAAFGQIGTAVSAAVSGTSGRVAVFNGTNSVTGYTGFTSDTSGNVAVNALNSSNQVVSYSGSGAAAFVTDTTSKSWAWYPSGTGLNLFEYTTTFEAGGGNDRLRISAGGAVEFVGAVTLDSALSVGGNVGFYGTTPIAKPTVTSSRGGNAALASLLTALANLGLITDSTTV